MEKIDADYKRLLGCSIFELREQQGQLTIKEREERKHNIERFMRESLEWLNFLSYELELTKDDKKHAELVEERNYHEQKLVEYVIREIEIYK